ncbi:hypothetical protein GBA52_003901 [Prunus armeniaca]|nr:hypothetical protein GBA52_003901 [Prunus armeniaca]
MNPPRNASESCWAAYQALPSEFVANFHIRTSCWLQDQLDLTSPIALLSLILVCVGEVIGYRWEWWLGGVGGGGGWFRRV